MKKPKHRPKHREQPTAIPATVLATVIGGAGWNNGGPHSPPQPGG